MESWWNLYNLVNIAFIFFQVVVGVFFRISSIFQIHLDWYLILKDKISHQLHILLYFRQVFSYIFYLHNTNQSCGNAVIPVLQMVNFNEGTSIAQQMLCIVLHACLVWYDICKVNGEFLIKFSIHWNRPWAIFSFKNGKNRLYW